MRLRSTLSIIVLLFTCIACYPALQLQVINQSESHAQVIWELDTNKKESKGPIEF